MIQNHLGELAALVTAVCWTFTSTAFELAGRRVGSLSVNFIRLIIAFFLLGLFTTFSRGMFLPLDASSKMWFWLIISGLVGFVIGDMFLFQAFVEVGARISMLVMASVPPITALLGFLILGETITVLNLVGMIITILGIALVILVRDKDNNKVELSYSVKGLVYAFIGAIGQSLGLILSKIGVVSYDPFAATQIRIIAATIGFALVFMVTKKWDGLMEAIKNKKAMVSISVGALFGPFLGVSFSLLAIQYTTTGIASTIMAIVPVLIIPVSILVFKEKISIKEVMGAIVTVLGVGILFL